MMQKFSCWELYSEGFTGHWDEPDRVVQAANHVKAAEEFADREHASDDGIAVLVREDATGMLVEIEMHKEWTVDMYKPTTVEAQQKRAEEP